MRALFKLGFAVLVTMVVACAAIVAADAAETLPGPFVAKVVRVIDADTVSVEVRTWPGQRVRVAVRVNGIDTPEARRADCPAEKRLGLAASSFVKVWLSPGTRVTLTKVHEGKFAGRVVADIHREIAGADGPVWKSLAETLIERDEALPYDGEGARPDWCAIAARREMGARAIVEEL